MELKECLEMIYTACTHYDFVTTGKLGTEREYEGSYEQAYDTVLEELNNYKWLIKSAKGFIEDNSHEFICKRDGGLPELEFDNNTNASDLLDILDGNY